MKMAVLLLTRVNVRFQYQYNDKFDQNKQIQPMTHRQSSSYADIVLQSKKPILTIQLMNCPKNDTNAKIFLITTIDRWVYVIEVICTMHRIIQKIQLQDVCTATFYDQANKILLVGCSNTCIKFDKGKKSTYQINKKLEFGYIVTLYMRKNKIFAWTLNGQLLIIDEKTMLAQSAIFFDSQLTSITKISNGCSTVSGCASFANGLPPFIFDCNTAEQIRQTFSFLSEYYDQAEYKNQNEQIIQLAQNLVDSSSKEGHDKIKGRNLAAVSWNPGITNQYIITIYAIQTIQQHRVCQIKIRFSINALPTHIHLHNQHLMICKEQRVEVFNLDTRNKVCKIKNKRMQWGYIMQAHKYEDIFQQQVKQDCKQNEDQNQIQNEVQRSQNKIEKKQKQQFRFIISRGFNFWDPENSQKGISSLHFVEGSKVLSG